MRCSICTEECLGETGRKIKERVENTSSHIC